jgi:hypothetical protein
VKILECGSQEAADTEWKTPSFGNIFSDSWMMWRLDQPSDGRGRRSQTKLEVSVGVGRAAQAEIEEAVKERGAWHDQLQRLLDAGWQRPGRAYDDGLRLRGHTVYVQKFGKGTVVGFARSLGQGKHRIQFDESGEKDIALERKGNFATPWAVLPKETNDDILWRYPYEDVADEESATVNAGSNSGMPGVLMLTAEELIFDPGGPWRDKWALLDMCLPEKYNNDSFSVWTLECTTRPLVCGFKGNKDGCAEFRRCLTEALKAVRASLDPVWEYKSEGVWVPYDRVVAAVLEAAAGRGDPEATVLLDRDRVRVDLCHMVQEGPRIEPVRRTGLRARESLNCLAQMRKFRRHRIHNRTSHQLELSEQVMQPKSIWLESPPGWIDCNSGTAGSLGEGQLSGQFMDPESSWVRYAVAGCECDIVYETNAMRICMSSVALACLAWVAMVWY